MKAKTLKDLAADAGVRTLERVQAESPSIRDTPTRRLSVFRSELAALAAEHHLDALDSEIELLAVEFAFGPQPAPASASLSAEPEPEPEAPVSDEK